VEERVVRVGVRPNSAGSMTRKATASSCGSSERTVFPHDSVGPAHRSSHDRSPGSRRLSGETARQSNRAVGAPKQNGIAPLPASRRVASTRWGLDQYMSTHVFEPLPDGGRITLQRDTDDSAGTEQIRRHMQQIAMAFRSGDFSLPGFVHAGRCPALQSCRQDGEAITYTVEELPRGAALTLRSTDSAAILAIHEFLAFSAHGSPWRRPLTRVELHPGCFGRTLLPPLAGTEIRSRGSGGSGGAALTLEMRAT
jgi:hypothetical protein